MKLRLLELFNYLKRKVKKIMATQAEMTQQIKTIGEKLTKVGTETSVLLTKIEELKQTILNGPDVTPELQAAVDAVAVQAQVVDDLVPDATP